MSAETNTVTIEAAGDDFGRVARLLLAIVGNGRAQEVRSVTAPVRGFQVPEDVAVEYVRRHVVQPTPTPEPGVDGGGSSEPEAAEPVVESEPKRRGRRPKGSVA